MQPQSDKVRRKGRAKRKSSGVADVQKETEAQKVYGWRLDCFKRMGFKLADARELADSAADLHEVEQLIRNNCPHDTAKRIVL